MSACDRYKALGYGIATREVLVLAGTSFPTKTRLSLTSTYNVSPGSSKSSGLSWNLSPSPWLAFRMSIERAWRGELPLWGWSLLWSPAILEISCEILRLVLYRCLVVWKPECDTAALEILAMQCLAERADRKRPYCRSWPPGSVSNLRDASATVLVFMISRHKILEKRTGAPLSLCIVLLATGFPAARWLLSLKIWDLSARLSLSLISQLECPNHCLSRCIHWRKVACSACSCCGGSEWRSDVWSNSDSITLMIVHLWAPDACLR